MTVRALGRFLGHGAAALLAQVVACAPAPEPGPGGHRVIIEDLVYRPRELAVAVGDSVTWINRDIVPHTVTLAGGRSGPDTIGPGEEITIVMSESGKTRYVCRYHPAMAGILEVR